MKFIKLALAAVAAMSLSAVSAHAAVQSFDVLAKDHSLKPTDTALGTGIILAAGEGFSVSADVADTWVLGAGAQRIINADGSTFFGNYMDPVSGQSFLFGALVGRIGTGDYFLIGSDFDGFANAAGELFLLTWDSNDGDNSGFITAAVTTSNAVPLPPAIAVMALGVAGFGAMRKKRVAA